jgi:energy-coupling factor transporter ATP-binding protein EcfA2
MSKTRDLHVSGLMVGRKGTGKSTKLAKIAAAYPPDSKVLIIDVNGSPAYNQFQQITINQVKLLKKGVVRLLGTPSAETLTTIATHFRGGLIVFEDCTKYIEGNVRPEIKTFLVDHRMFQCDLIFTFHSLKRVPPFFWEMISYVTLLKTLETFDPGTYRSKIPNYEKIAEAFKKVNSQKDDYFGITVETLI